MKYVVSFLILFNLQFALAEEAPKMTEEAKVTQTSDKRMGFNLEPLWLLTEAIGVKFEYFINDRYSIGIGGVLEPEHYRTTYDSDTEKDVKDDFKTYYHEINLGTNIMLTGNLSSNGFYINPSIGTTAARISEFSDLKLSSEVSVMHARLTAGYQWIAQDHIRVAAGGGLKFMNGEDISVKDASGEEIFRSKMSNLGGLALDVHVGLVF